MLTLQIITRSSECILNLDHVTSIEYNEKIGELTFVVGSYGRSFYVDKGTPTKTILDAIHMCLSPIYEPRSLQTHGVKLALNLLKFQTVDPEEKDPI